MVIAVARAAIGVLIVALAGVVVGFDVGFVVRVVVGGGLLGAVGKHDNIVVYRFPLLGCEWCTVRCTVHRVDRANWQIWGHLWWNDTIFAMG